LPVETDFCLRSQNYKFCSPTHIFRPNFPFFDEAAEGTARGICAGHARERVRAAQRHGCSPGRGAKRPAAGLPRPRKGLTEPLPACKASAAGRTLLRKT